MESSTQKTKSFFERPEGTTGMIFLFGIIATLGYGFYKILPFLLTLIQNTLYLVGMGVALFAILFVLLDPQFRAGIWYLYKILMRKLTGLVINIDPIAILKIHIQNLKERREQMNEKMALVKGQQEKLRRTIETNKANMKDSAIRAQVAETKGPNYKGEVGLQMREYGRGEKLNGKLEPLQTKLKDLYEFLLKLYTNSDYVIRDMESEVRMSEIEYNAVKEGSNAIKSARSIFSGGDDEMYKQAVDMLEMDMSNRIGEIDQFMRTTDSIIKGIDLDNGAYEMKGFQMLEEFKSKDFDFLLQKTDTQERIVIPAGTPTVQITSSKNNINNLLD